MFKNLSIAEKVIPPAQKQLALKVGILEKKRTLHNKIILFVISEKEATPDYSYLPYVS